jgi:general secretion pathway protein B
MSFILDALKKLEQNRHEGTVPDLTTIHTSESSGPKKRPYILYLIIIALILNVAMITMWLNRSDPDKGESALLSSSVIERADSELKALSLNPSSPGEVKTASVRKAAPSETSTPQKADDALQKSSQIPIETGKIDVPEKSPVQKESQVHEAGSGETEKVEVKTSSLKIMPTAEELSDLKDRIKEERKAVSQTPPVEAEPVKEEKDSPDVKIVEFHQLPADVKKDLPEMSISGHIYSNSPSSRLVNINGIIIREGETVKKGLKVTEITTNAVVFNFKEYHFRIRAF